MPRISAPTVAQHRARQRSALLEAARRIVVRAGPDAVTFAAVAREADLARNSVYEYFDDRVDLLRALIEADFPAWRTAIDTAMASARSPRARVIAYMRTQLDLVAEGRHEIGHLFAGGRLPEELRQLSRTLHEGLAEPLIAALGELDLTDPHRTAALVQGIINAATSRIEQGDNAHATIEEAERLLSHGLPRRRPAP